MSLADLWLIMFLRYHGLHSLDSLWLMAWCPLPMDQVRAVAFCNTFLERLVYPTKPMFYGCLQLRRIKTLAWAHQVSNRVQPVTCGHLFSLYFPVGTLTSSLPLCFKACEVCRWRPHHNSVECRHRGKAPRVWLSALQQDEHVKWWPGSSFAESYERLKPTSEDVRHQTSKRMALRRSG